MLRVSPDTVRRLVDSGHIKTARSAGGQRQIDGPGLARYMAALPLTKTLLRRQVNRPAIGFVGIVTRVIKDGVAAQVEVQAGPHRIVSLITRESADELGLKPGVVAVASVKATNVGIELPHS